jgi:hypothetical protein
VLLTDYNDAHHGGVLSRIDERYPVFFGKPYSSFVTGSGRHRLVFAFSETDSICAPLRLSKVRFFKLAQFEYPPVRDGERLQPAEEARFLKETVSLLKRGGLCHRLVQPPTHCLFGVAPEGSVSCRFGSYVLDLRASSEKQLLAGLSKDHRRGIRQAWERAVRVEFGLPVLEDCFRLCAETMKRSKMWFMSREDFFSFYQHLGPSEQILCAVAYDGAQPLGGLLVPFTKARAFAMANGIPAQMSVPGANKLLQWEAICHLRRRGVERYDFVGARLSDVHGSKLEEIQRFKAGFGCRLQEGFLWKLDVNRSMCRLFDFMVAVLWQLRGMGKPKGDIIDQELGKQALAAPAPGAIPP